MMSEDSPILRENLLKITCMKFSLGFNWFAHFDSFSFILLYKVLQVLRDGLNSFLIAVGMASFAILLPNPDLGDPADRKDRCEFSAWDLAESAIF